MHNILTGTQVPSDFSYFRSTSPVYRKYLEKGRLSTLDAGKQFGWYKDFWWFQIVKFERTDLPPTRELLDAHGFKRGLVLWIPSHVDKVDREWHELWIPGGHFIFTGIGRSRPLYYTAWNERAKRARKRFLAQNAIRIVTSSEEEFVEAFQKTKVAHSYKKEYIKYYRDMCKAGPESIRSYLAVKEDGTPVAGLAVHDFDNTSIHLVAFTGKEAHQSQAGTGLIDKWYSDSLEMGLTYIHFDHLRDHNMTRDQQGYTDFKLNFIEDRIMYKKCYFQFW